MLFNSLEFFVFIFLAFVFYWKFFNKSLKIQNTFVLCASYVFYGWWDFRFLALILISTILDFLIGKKLSIEKSEQKRKYLLWASLILNLGMLMFFKYFNFFIESFIDSFSFFGVTLDITTLNILLPVGISFYTFQTLSYTIDVFKKKIKPSNDFIDFAAFVSFFPQLVAGPIERASYLLPQFQKRRVFNYEKVIDGLRQFLWGGFKKIVIADSCAEHVNYIFQNYADLSASTLAVGAIYFSLQIYCDFSGYSDMAIGISKLFGFNLSQNFAFPYFSRNVGEFWRRWHISLSTWFRDYLYIPLGGSKGNLFYKIRNTMIIFLVSGLWHGANWTFIVWGALNGLYLIPLLLNGRNRNYIDIVANGSVFATYKEYIQIIFTFCLISVTWIFFRAENLTIAFNYIGGLFSASIFSFPQVFEFKLTIFILFFFFIEWIGREEKHPLARLGMAWPSYLRYLFYYILILIILLFGGTEQAFIYFQF